MPLGFFFFLELRRAGRAAPLPLRDAEAELRRGATRGRLPEGGLLILACQFFYKIGLFDSLVEGGGVKEVINHVINNWADTKICAKFLHFSRSSPLETARFIVATPVSQCCESRDVLRGQHQPQGVNDVKLIIAAIKPFKLEEVREALTSIGVRGMMVTEIKGFGSQSGHTEIYRGAEYAVNFVPKVKLEIVVADGLADQVVDTIHKTAKTDKIGDGKIFVLDVASSLRVRTGETGDDAL